MLALIHFLASLLLAAVWDAATVRAAPISKPADLVGIEALYEDHQVNASPVFPRGEEHHILHEINHCRDHEHECRDHDDNQRDVFLIHPPRSEPQHASEQKGEKSEEKDTPYEDKHEDILALSKLFHGKHTTEANAEHEYDDLFALFEDIEECGDDILAGKEHGKCKEHREDFFKLLNWIEDSGHDVIEWTEHRHHDDKHHDGTASSKEHSHNDGKSDDGSNGSKERPQHDGKYHNGTTSSKERPQHDDKSNDGANSSRERTHDDKKYHNGTTSAKKHSDDNGRSDDGTTSSKKHSNNENEYGYGSTSSKKHSNNDNKYGDGKTSSKKHPHEDKDKYDHGKTSSKKHSRSDAHREDIFELLSKIEDTGRDILESKDHLHKGDKYDDSVLPELFDRDTTESSWYPPDSHHGAERCWHVPCDPPRDKHGHLLEETGHPIHDDLELVYESHDDDSSVPANTTKTATTGPVYAGEPVRTYPEDDPCFPHGCDSNGHLKGHPEEDILVDAELSNSEKDAQDAHEAWEEYVEEGNVTPEDVEEWTSMMGSSIL